MVFDDPGDYHDEDDEWEDISEESEDFGHENSEPEQNWMKIEEGLESGALQELDMNVLSQFLGLESQAPSFSSASGRSISLSLRALFLFQQYEEENDITHLSEAIISLEEAAILESPPQNAATLQSLARMLGERYSINEDLEDFERGLSLGQQALSSSESKGMQGRCLHTLSKLHQFHFCKTFTINDLDVAIQMGRQAMIDIPHGYQQRSIYPAHLAELYMKRFHILWDPADIDTAIEFGSKALELSDDEEDRAVHCMCLSSAFGSRYELAEDPEDLAAAIRLAEEAVHITPKHEHHLLADRFHNLSTLLLDQFDRFGDPKNLGEAIRLAKEAIKIAEQLEDESHLISYLDNYVSLLDGKFCAEDDINCLNEAVNLAEEVLRRILDQDPVDRVLYLSHVADIFARCFKRLQNIEDLEKAIAVKEDALAALFGNELNSHRIDLQIDLSDYLHMMYIKMGSSDCLKRAVELTAPMLGQDFTESLNRPSHMKSLIQRFKDRYVITGSLSDLHASIVIAEKALKQIAPDHPLYISCLLQLSLSLEVSFDVKGSLGDLERSISSSMEGLHMISDASFKRAGFLYTLSSQLLKRYHHVGSFVDLEQSIRLLEESKDATPDDQPMHLACLHGLSIRYSVLHDRSKEIQLLNKAINYAKETNSLCPNHPLTRAVTLSNLGFLYESSFTATESKNDLQIATEYHRAALNNTPEDYSDRNFFLSCLGGALTKLFQNFGGMINLLEAYRLCSQGLKGTPKGHPERAELLNDMGKIITIMRDNNMGSEIPSHEDDSPLELFTEALDQQNAPILDRIKSGQNAFNCYVTRHHWSKAIRVAEDVLKLVRLLVPRWLSRNDQQHLLRNIARFASRVASAFIQQDGPAYDALQALEEGRGIISDLTVDLKADISELQYQNSTLHAEYMQLRRQVLLNFASPVLPFTLDPKSASGTLHKLLNTGVDREKSLHRLKLLESKIRSLDGFQHFLRPISPLECMRLAGSHSIVALNVTEIRSDAILITNKQISTIHLEGLDFHTMKNYVSQVIGKERLSRGPVRTRADRNQKLFKITSWLWDVAVKPVLIQLKLYREQRPSRPVGRICWVSNGDMGILPLHAAGNETENALDYVVSSYTPTLQVLKFSKERQDLMPWHDKLKMLIVPAPRKPGSRDLKTTKEIESIKMALLNNTSPNILDEPILETVLEELPKHDIVHFSCHGHSNVIDPSNSALWLSFRKNSDEVSSLAVRDLAALDHEKAQIAYLSACSTAENSSPELIDEVIHIASAFQTAGFPHVIGTLWEVGDDAAAEISPQFYKNLIEQATDDQWPRKDVACAIHDALQKYRTTRSKDVISWSSFIHMGANE